jgi:pilus assembly protein CpaB
VRSKTPIYVAGILLAATLVSFIFFKSYGNSGGLSVFIAVTDLQAGATIKRDDLKEIIWPEPTTPVGSISDIAKIDGRVAKVTILAGESILETKLAPVDAKGGLSSVITPGKRAITVKVNEVVAVAGFALPGSYVDVIVNAVDAQNQAFSKVVLEKVKILAVAQETATDTNKPRVVNAVTLELTPAESEQLDLARNIGRLSLVLRNEFDQSTATNETRGARISDLVSKARETVAPAQNKKINNGIEEIRGTAKSDKGG